MVWAARFASRNVASTDMHNLIDPLSSPLSHQLHTRFLFYRFLHSSFRDHGVPVLPYPLFMHLFQHGYLYSGCSRRRGSEPSKRVCSGQILKRDAC